MNQPRQEYLRTTNVNDEVYQLKIKLALASFEEKMCEKEDFILLSQYFNATLKAAFCVVDLKVIKEMNDLLNVFEPLYDEFVKTQAPDITSETVTVITSGIATCKAFWIKYGNDLFLRVHAAEN